MQFNFEHLLINQIINQMKTTKQKVYASPKAEVIEIEAQGVLCTSSGAATSTGAGGGTTDMNYGTGYGW